MSASSCLPIEKIYNTITNRLLDNPDDAEALVQRHWCLNGGGRRDINVALARRAVKIDERFETVFNLGSALLTNGDTDEALDRFRQAYDMSLDKRAMHHIGLALHELGRTTEALAAYKQAEGQPGIERSIALAKLTEGKLHEGLFAFEVEHHEHFKDKPILQTDIPRWRGEDLTDKTIIIAHEQGFGDTIQFCRFIPQIQARRVLWSGPDVLTDLIVEDIEFDGLVPENGPFEADYYASPMSACAALGIEYSDVCGDPYISAQPMKLPQRGFRVGLVWRGSEGYARDYERSAKLEDFTQFFEIPGLSFYSLQYGKQSSEDIDRAGLGGFIADLGHYIDGRWTDAKAGESFDVVVSVDSSPAHMAGALGKPLMLLLSHAPCWRWRDDHNTTPWYRSAQIFRQTRAGVWMIERVANELEKMLGQAD